MSKEYKNRWNKPLVNPPITHAEYEARRKPQSTIAFNEHDVLIVTQAILDAGYTLEDVDKILQQLKIDLE